MEGLPDAARAVHLNGVMARKVVCIVYPPRSRDRDAVLRTGSQIRAAAFLKHGYEPLFLSADDKRFAERIARCGENPEVIAFYSSGSWAVDADGIVGGDGANLLANFEKPVICTIGDHPFNPWVVAKIDQEFANKFSFYNDPASARHVIETREVTGYHGHSTPAASDYKYDYEAARRPANERDIPLMIAGIFVNVDQLRHTIRTQFAHLSALFERFIEAGLENYHESIFNIGARLFKAAGEQLDFSNPKINTFFSLVDWWIRNERRRRLFEGLARYPMLVIARNPQHMPKLHPDSRLMEPIPFPELLALSERCRVMPMALPTYAGGITERIVNAMHRGTAVLTTTNAAVEDFFEPDENLLTLAPDFSDLDAKIEHLQDDRVVDEMTEKARHAIYPRFTTNRVVARYLEIIQDAGYGT